METNISTDALSAIPPFLRHGAIYCDMTTQTPPIAVHFVATDQFPSLILRGQIRGKQIRSSARMTYPLLLGWTHLDRRSKCV